MRKVDLHDYGDGAESSAMLLVTTKSQGYHIEYFAGSLVINIRIIR